MSARLDAIRNRELHGLTAGEQIRVAALTTTAAIRQGHRDGRAAESAAARIWDQAERRVLAEDAAAARIENQKIQDKANAKAERRAKRRW